MTEEKVIIGHYRDGLLFKQETRVVVDGQFDEAVQSEAGTTVVFFPQISGRPAFVICGIEKRVEFVEQQVRQSPQGLTDGFHLENRNIFSA